MTKKINTLQIYKNDIYVGELSRTSNGCEIKFAPEFVKTHENQQIAYHLKVKSSPFVFSGVNLPPYFAGLLPEGLRLKALVKKIKTSTDDMFSLLVAAGSDPVGDLHFKNSDEVDELPVDFTKIKAALKKAQNLDSKLLAGVQNKISADRITLPVNIKKKEKSYILKLESDEYPESLQNEDICLRIAKSCGLNVNKAKIIKDKNDVAALLIERFDRDWNPKLEKWLRYHQEDACQFLDKYPADKYNLSFQEIAKGIQQFSLSPEIEILKLLQLKAFSYLMGNGDLHAKNISLLKDQLSPCYDILCTALYGDDKMALLFDGKNNNIKRKNFVDFGKRYGLTASLVESMLDKLIPKFNKHYENIFLLDIAKEKEKHLRTFFKKRIKDLE